MKRFFARLSEFLRPKRIIHATQVDLTIVPEGHVPVLVFDEHFSPEHIRTISAEFDKWRERVRNGEPDAKITVLFGGVRLISVPRSSL